MIKPYKGSLLSEATEFSITGYPEQRVQLKIPLELHQQGAGYIYMQRKCRR